MTVSKESIAMTTEDAAKLKAEMIGGGCLWILTAPIILLTLFLVFIFNPKDVFSAVFLAPAALVVVSGAVWFAFYKHVQRGNAAIEKDIIGGQKTVIVAPITDKRIKSREITGGVQKGSIASNYFMTIDGREYPMSERKYLTIPIGELMEIHLAPASKNVLRERWRKKDGTVAEEAED